ncbi:MAG: hypothetical protein ACT4RN_16810 [Pseudonocardia sp.]
MTTAPLDLVAPATLPPLAPTWPAAHVLLDAEDTLACVRELSASHDFDAGVVVCHPGPHNGTDAALAEDVLVALGKRPGGLVEEGLRRRDSWDLASAWLRAERVRHLVILRAHRLPAASWCRLTELAASLDLAVWLVVHRFGLDPAHQDALHGRSQVRAWRAVLPVLAAGSLAAVGSSPFPTVPDAEFPTFRAVTRRLLPPADFARVDDVYRAAHAKARNEARLWRRMAGSPRSAAALIQRMTVDAASSAEVYTRIRGIQAAFFLHGLLLQLRLRNGIPSSWQTTSTTPRFTPATIARLRLLHSPTAAAALTLARATGLDAKGLAGLRSDALVATADHGYLVRDGNTGLHVPAAVSGAIRAHLTATGAPDDDQPAPALFPGTTGQLQKLLDTAGARAGTNTGPGPVHVVEILDVSGPATSQ